MTALCTIGFAGKDLEDFVTLLRGAGVARLLDVRLRPDGRRCASVAVLVTMRVRRASRGGVRAVSRIVLAVFALALACGALSLAAPASAQDASAGAAATGAQQADCRYALVDGAAVRVVLDDDRTGAWDADGNWYNGGAVYSGSGCPTDQPVPNFPDIGLSGRPSCADDPSAVDYAFCAWNAGSSAPQEDPV